MFRDYQKLFAYLSAPEPSPEFWPRVLEGLRREQRRVSRQRLVLFSLSAAGSLVLFGLAARLAWSEFVASGFAHFFSLLFSDFELVTACWKNFIFSLLEALPAGGLIFFLASVLACLQSIKLLAKDAVN